jgi:hypothetical protein
MYAKGEDISKWEKDAESVKEERGVITKKCAQYDRV